MPTTEIEKQTRWFVMRDLKRPNAKLPAYKFLREEGFEVFVPMKPQLITKHGKKVVEDVPVIRDLLFAHTDKKRLDPIVARTETLQYRFMRNCGRAPMMVPDDEMERFHRCGSAPRMTPNIICRKKLLPKCTGVKSVS